MKRLLVAVDGSPGQRLVIEAAVKLARAAGGEVVLFRAVGIPVELPPGALAASPDEVGGLLLEHAKADLNALVAQLPRELGPRARVDLGVAWRAICEAARVEQADLIVIGSHGFGGLDRLLGTTAAKVVNHADQSVYVVRPSS